MSRLLIGCVAGIVLTGFMGCGKKSPTAGSPRVCGDTPPRLGEQYVYRDLESGTRVTFTAEPTNETINGYAVFRWHRSDFPAGVGAYYGCDPVLGLVEVADESFTYPPLSVHRNVHDRPRPIWVCRPDAPVGTVASWYRSDDSLYGEIWEVVASEAVSVPYGTFREAHKIQISYVKNREVSEVWDIWVDKTVGLVKIIVQPPDDDEWLGLELTGFRAASSQARDFSDDALSEGPAPKPDWNGHRRAFHLVS